jgi:release factor glutamine methyltransferase
MPASASPDSYSQVVSTLRAAGCVYAEDEARLLVAAAATPAELGAMVRRRADGQPLEHIVGWAEFCGLRIAMYPGVFVPRRRTEFLVRQAAGLVRHGGGQPAASPGSGAGPVVVDLCCGSGALGVALAAAAGPVQLHAADIDPAAVRCARRNMAAAGGRVYRGDLYDSLPSGLRGTVTILLANVPYVPTEEVGLLPAEARDHEARVALDGGPDGLDVLRRVTAAAPQWLAPGGHLLFETSDRQVAGAAAAVAGAGLIPRVARCGELAATVVIAARPGGDSPAGGRR